MIKIKDLNKAYDKNKVLDCIILNVNTGFVYALLGKNGVGKTTLIDLLQADSGTILINGKEHNRQHTITVKAKNIPEGHRIQTNDVLLYSTIEPRAHVHF